MRFAFDEFVFDDLSYELRQHGALLKVDSQVLELLSYLLRNPARVVTKQELIAEVWQSRALGDNVISVCVAKLRKVLGGSSNRCISNVYGRGYRFLRPVLRTNEPTAEQPATSPSPSTAVSNGEPFVGRSAALARLKAALERVGDSRGTVCALLGEAGIGKTRAAEVLEEHAVAAGFRVSWGRCHAFGNVPPLWPWLQIVRSGANLLPPELTAQHFDKRTRTPEVGAADGSASGTHSALEPATSGAWHTTLTWISGVAARMTADQPWLIVLEDAQWADAASLQLLSHLVVELAQLPLLIVLTVRDTELPRDERCRRALDFVLGHRDCERIELSRLHAADVDAYTTALFGTCDASLTEAVVSKSEGNPFFMVELLRPWIGGPAPAPSELALSGLALDIVRQAVRLLSADAREVLAAASVIGRSFDLGLLASVTKRDSEALLETLEESMTSHVVIADREAHTHFAFGHDLIRSLLYDELSTLARVRLHQRVAEALSARQSLRSPLASAELAHHLLSALPGGNVQQAVEGALNAARAAAHVGAYADACAFLRRALEAVRLQPEIDPATVCNLLFTLAHCERGAGGPSFSVHLQEAVTLAQRHGFGEILAAAGQLMSGPPGTVGMRGAGAVLEAALEALPETNYTLRAIMYAHLAWTPPNCRDSTRVAALLKEADALAAKAGNEAVNTVLRAKMYFASGPDDQERALAIAAEMERRGDGWGDSILRTRGPMERLIARAVALLQHGEHHEAQRVLDVYGTAVHEFQHAELIWHYDRLCMVLHINAGEFEYAKAQLKGLKERAERIQLHAHRALEAVDRMEIVRHTADVTPFAAQLASQLRQQTSDPPSVHAYKLRALAHLGLLDEARTALQAIPVEDLYLLPKNRDYLATLGHLAFVSSATRALPHAAALYELLQPYPNAYVASLSFHCYGTVSHSLAILSRALGHRDRALLHFEVALVDQERLGWQPQLAYTRYELAHMLSETSNRDDLLRASSLLEQVRDACAQLGMEPLRGASERLLRELEARRAIEPETAPTHLYKAQHEGS